MTDSNVNVNVNAKELKEIKALVVEITNLYSKIDSDKEAIKDIVASIAEKFGIKKKLVTKIAKTMYQHNYSDIQHENEHFQFLYEAIAEGRKIENTQKVETEDEIDD